MGEEPALPPHDGEVLDADGRDHKRRSLSPIPSLWGRAWAVVRRTLSYAGGARRLSSAGNRGGGLILEQVAHIVPRPMCHVQHLHPPLIDPVED